MVEDSDSNVEEHNEDVLDPIIKKKLWMIRDCNLYDNEYADCKSFRSRFHQYFIFGETLDCTQWRRDSDNCYRWKKANDIESAKELIESETKRRQERLAPFINNSCWENRTEPPDNWNTPLPKWMEEENKNSFLAMKAEEEKNMNEGDILSSRQSLCIIM